MTIMKSFSNEFSYFEWKYSIFFDESTIDLLISTTTMTIASKLKSIDDNRTMLKTWIIINKSFQKIDFISIKTENDEFMLLRNIFFVWANVNLLSNEFVKIISVKNISSFLFFETLIWRISVDWISAKTENCFVEILKRKRSTINEYDETIDKRTCDFESLNLSFLKTSDDKKNEFSRRNVTENDFRSMMKKIDCCVKNLLLNLFDESLLSEKLFVIDKKLK